MSTKNTILLDERTIAPDTPSTGKWRLYPKGDGWFQMDDAGVETNLSSGGTDVDAIHDNVAAEISVITEKGTPISGDHLLIEDSADSNNKKRIQIGNLPASGDVSKSGTPVNDQLAIWTDDSTIEGNSDLTYDPTFDALSIGVSGDLRFGALNVLSDASGTVTLRNIATIDGATGSTLNDNTGPFIQGSNFVYNDDIGGTDAYAISVSPVITGYVSGHYFHFKANTINTGAATLNVDSQGAKTIVKHHDQTLADGDIEAGQIVTVMYDGTNFQMQSQLGNAPVSAIPTWFHDGFLLTSNLDSTSGIYADVDATNVKQTVTVVSGQTVKATFYIGRVIHISGGTGTYKLIAGSVDADTLVEADYSLTSSGSLVVQSEWTGLSGSIDFKLQHKTSSGTTRISSGTSIRWEVEVYA